MKSLSSSNFESYPPLFHRTPLDEIDHFDHDEDEEKEEEKETDIHLPVLDFQCINQEELAEACEDWGIFRLVNHGIPLTLLSQLHEHAKKIFDLSFQSKQGLFSSSPVTYFWGTAALSSTGAALPKHQNFNWMEGFNVPLTQLSQLHATDPLLDSFRFLLEEYGKHQGRLAGTIFKAMAQNLNMKEAAEESSSHLSPSTGLLRVYRYPLSCSKQQPWGMEVHTDSSVLSILNQDQVGGLQFYKDGSWLDVKPISNTFIVNLGDMMQAISDDKYKSVKHRVRVDKHKERISVGYFVFPEEKSLIKSSTYRPFSYADFQAQVQLDLNTIGFKVGLPRFKLLDST